MLCEEGAWVLMLTTMVWIVMFMNY